MHLQCLPIKNYGRAGYVDDPFTKHCIHGYLDACLHSMVYYASSSTACVVVFGPFFSA